MTAEPADRFYESQGLRLHYVDWGNETAPPLILVHGGLDHCRNWDAIARELQPHFHIMAPDLRGHGDSEWAKGSSYSLTDHVYDLSRLIRFAGAAGCRHRRSFAGWNDLARLCRNLSGSGIAPCRVGRGLPVALPIRADP
jgi:alpha-beta hydrolase superfamily lysophospholipase